jgi:hypothetical protein
MKKQSLVSREVKTEAVKRDDHICQICGCKTRGYATALSNDKGVRPIESSEYITLCGRFLMMSSKAPDRAVSRAWKMPIETLPILRCEVRQKLETIRRGK